MDGSLRTFANLLICLLISFALWLRLRVERVEGDEARWETPEVLQGHACLIPSAELEFVR